MTTLRFTLILGFLLGVVVDASALSREEVMLRAKGFAYHPWTCTAANFTGRCDTGYQSVYWAGDFMGLPYDWGGYMTLFEFDQQIGQGYGAGSYSSDGVLSCTSGLDCSGYVSQCWGSGHYGTSFFAPVPMVDLEVGVPCTQKPAKVRDLVHRQDCEFTWAAGQLKVKVPRLELFAALAAG